MHEVFVNYRTGDAQDAAAAINVDLSHRFGTHAVFFAGKSIPAGQDFREALPREVRRSRVLLAVIGENWLKRDPHGRRLLDDPEDWVRREIAEALDHGVEVIPILVGRKLDRLPGDLPRDISELTSRNYRRYDHREAEKNLATIAEDVVALVPSLTKAGASADQASQTPVTNTNQRGGVGMMSGGSIGTMIGESHGNVNTGSGDQNNGPYRREDRDA